MTTATWSPAQRSARSCFAALRSANDRGSHFAAGRVARRHPGSSRRRCVRCASALDEHLAEEVALAQRHAFVAQDVVGCRRMEIEVGSEKESKKLSAVNGSTIFQLGSL